MITSLVLSAELKPKSPPKLNRRRSTIPIYQPMELSAVFPESPKILSPLRILSESGQGKFTVYEVFSPKHGSNFALKLFPKDNIGTKQYKKEIVLENLRHQNIIQSVPLTLSDSKYFGIMMEFGEHGCFKQAVLNGLLSTDILMRTYFHQLVEGIEYIHSQEVAHLDLKLENLLLGSDFLLKIIDFDQAQSTSDERMTSYGTPDYRPVEVIDGTCQNLKAVDVYSAGIILYIFKTGQFPFLENIGSSDKKTWSYAMYLENTDDFWKAKMDVDSNPNSVFTEDFIELMNGMIHRSPDKRFKIDDIKESKWYKGPVLSIQSLKLRMKVKQARV